MGIIKAFHPSTIYSDLKSLNINQLSFLFGMLVIMTGLSLYWKDTTIGILAGITGVTCVFLVNMRKLSNFFWGTINAVLYGYVAYTASYYGDTMLNWVFYLPIQFIGAYFWSRDMVGSEVISKKLPLNSLYKFTSLTIITCALYSVVLQQLGGKLFGVDSITTVLSFLATFLMIKGYREQWVCWITVNVLSIIMWTVNFAETGTGYGVLIMWTMFLANSVYGCYTWFKNSK